MDSGLRELFNKKLRDYLVICPPQNLWNKVEPPLCGKCPLLSKQCFVTSSCGWLPQAGLNEQASVVAGPASIGSRFGSPKEGPGGSLKSQDKTYYIWVPLGLSP